MALRYTLLLAWIALTAGACGSSTSNNSVPQPGTAVTSSPKPVATVTPVPTSSTPKNGDYNAKGVVTKINTELGSIELDHEEVVGMMPAMRMEFYVSDKKMLNGLKLGDKVDFVIRYKDYTETIVGLKKAQ